MEQVLYSGTALSYLGDGKVSVWIPLKGPVPLGWSKWLYANTGSALDGSNLSMVENSSFICTISTPIGAGGWWKTLPEKGASFFGNGYREGQSIPYYPSLIDSKGRDSYVARNYPAIPSKMILPQSMGASSYHAVFTLQEIGGDPIPTIINPPKGKFAIPSPGHRVLVAFYDMNINPAVIALLPYEEEFKSTIDRNLK